MKRERHQQLAGDEALEESVWAAFPQDLLIQQVLCKLYIKDLLRMCVVSRSWNAAIHSNLIFINKHKLTRCLDLPWFYCMVIGRDAFQGRRAVAFDPNLNTWHRLPLRLKPSTQDTMPMIVEPICSLGSLVCWEYTYHSSTLRFRRTLVLITKAFSKYKEVLDASMDSSIYLHMERDDTGSVSFVFIHSQQPGEISILRYNHNQKEPAPSDNIEVDAPHTEMKFHVEKLLQWDYQQGSPKLPKRVYYHQGKLAFLQQVFSDDLIVYDGTNWSRVHLPRLSMSHKVDYRIVQMDEDLLLLILHQPLGGRQGQVLLYKYSFIDQGWLLLGSLAVYFRYDWSFQAVARSGLLMMIIEGKAYLCDLQSLTWRLVPHCPDLNSEPLSLIKLACPVDPTLELVW